jgi:hypothetical protein
LLQSISFFFKKCSVYEAEKFIAGWVINDVGLIGTLCKRADALLLTTDNRVLTTINRLLFGEVVNFNFSDLRHCGFHDAIVWIIPARKRCPPINDLVARFCHYFVYNRIIDRPGDSDANHLCPEVQPIKDKLRLCPVVADIAPLNDCIESFPFAGLFVQVIHREPEKITVVDDNFSDGVNISESDDKIPFVLCRKCGEGFKITVVDTGVVRLGAVSGTRYILAVLCG